MTILDGKTTAAQIRAELKERVAHLGFQPKLAVVLVGNDPASAIYVRNKRKACDEAGIGSVLVTLPETAAQEEVERAVEALCKDDEIDSVLVQLPLPAGLDEEKILKIIPPEKDADGFCYENAGRVALGERGISACTPTGVMELLSRAGIGVAGKRAVVLGRSKIVGRPMASLLLNADATVTVCHSKTKNLAEECLRAEILIVAIGKPNFLTADMVSEGAIVVDVGINRGADGKICGDVDFEAVKEKAAYLTPVPGGVGPMTIAMLLRNTVEAAERRA